MTVHESDVSILIPTYNRAHFIRDAIESALQTNAGEVIVSDDASADSTMELLSTYNDPRFTIMRQQTNIGVYANHLAAIKCATRPWIKFLHSDDLLLKGSISRMVNNISAETTVVWSNPVMFDVRSKNTWKRFTLNEPRYFTSDEYLKRLSLIGWELGGPSYMLIRRDALDLSDAAWRNDMWCDVVMGTVAASKGAVALLPSGNIVQRNHNAQDTATQCNELHTDRVVNTISFLMQSDDNRVRIFASVFGIVEAFGLVVNALGHLRRGRKLIIASIGRSSNYFVSLTHVI